MQKKRSLAKKYLPTGYLILALVILLFATGCGDQSKHSWLKAPINVIGTPSHRSILVEWDLVPEAQEYNIYWGTAAGVSPKKDESIRNVQSPYLLTGLTNGTPYFLIVTSVNASGESSPSTEVAATPIVGPPLQNPMGVFSSQEILAGEQLGWSVSLVGNLAAIGAPGYTNALATNAGAVYLFRRSTKTGLWAKSDIILPNDPLGNARFGESVAISRGVLLVGAPGASAGSIPSAGAAYTFVENTDLTWSESSKITITTPATGDGFGTSLAMTSTLGAIAAPYRTVGGNLGAGEVFTFTISGGVLSPLGSFVNPSSETQAQFGSALAMDGLTMMISAPAADTVLGGVTYLDAGKVFSYLFNATSQVWNSTNIIESNLPGNNFLFGSSISVSGDIAAVGVQNATVDNAGTAVVEAGRVEVLVRDAATGNWAWNVDLIEPVPTAHFHFGTTVGIVGNTIAVGSPFYSDADHNERGGVYMHKREPTTGIWAKGLLLNNIAPRAGEHMAWSLAIGVESLLLGAPDRSVSGQTSAGAFYAFE